MDEDELGDLLVTIISAHPQGVHELTLNAMLASLKLDARVRPS